jgi:hypothetical protein
MGNYQLCDYCGELYERTNRRMCRTCEQNYLQLRSIVEASPNSTVLELANLTGISVSRIHTFVRNGFFVMKEGTIEGIDSTKSSF